MKKPVVAVLSATLAFASLSGCASKRQIDPSETGSWPIEGTSWMGFCDGANAFIWVPSYNDTDPDELEAVVYDHWRCVEGGAGVAPGETRPDTDPDGIIEDED